jgi:hypothetical protein
VNKENKLQELNRRQIKINKKEEMKIQKQLSLCGARKEKIFADNL